MNSGDTKGTFVIEESFYNTNLLPKIENLFQPFSLMHFTFTLPFQFPLKDGTLFYLIYKNNAYFFHLDKFMDGSKEPLFAGQSGIDIAKMRTRVECALISKDDMAALDQQDHYSHLAHALNKFNGFINGYRILFEDWKTRPVTPENLHSVIALRIIKIDGWNIVKDSPLLVNENYSNIITNLTDKWTEIVHNCGAYLINGKNAFSVARVHFADARTHLFNGFYKESILSSQMAVESTVRFIYRLSLDLKGLNQNDVQQLLETTSFMSLIKKEMPRILGGNWDLKNKNLPVGKWHQVLYLKRNSIIHGGYAPLRHEAYECFVIVHEFLNEINALIKNKKSEHPALYNLGMHFPDYLLHGQEIGSSNID